MPVFKNESNNTWYVMARYVNWKGERKQKCKRGFTTKREAQEWERMFQLQTAADLDMSFEAFMELYTRDMERYADEREANQNLRQRIEMLQEENTRLKAVEHNFGRVWSYYGAEQVKRVVELMAGRERAAQNVQRQKREHENVI